MATVAGLPSLSKDAERGFFQGKRARELGALVEFHGIQLGPDGDLQFEEAMINDNAAYQDVGPTVALDAAGNKKLVITDPMCFLRWKTTAMNGTAKCIIDVIGRV